MQLKLWAAERREHSPQAGGRRAIECDEFPFEELSDIAHAESWRKEVNRPIYHIHKWWAQRLGSVFRAILIGALSPEKTDVLETFYSDVRFDDAVVLDPFMGSGTTIGEALKLGARAIGRDINPVSYLQARSALTLRDSESLLRAFHEIEKDVAAQIGEYFRGQLPDGTPCTVLYYFWVMQCRCPGCGVLIDLFSDYAFAGHVDRRRRPFVHVICPKCDDVTRHDSTISLATCWRCGHSFDFRSGPAHSRTATCTGCEERFLIADTIRATGGIPSYRMYAKMVLTPGGDKEYHPITDYDRLVHESAVSDVQARRHLIPSDKIEPGKNTDQMRRYGFSEWAQLFTQRQLAAASLIADRIRQLEDNNLRATFACFFSGVLEFNNLFASFKGEGTGAVRHMFHHHILKPERMALEANMWGTPKSSGAFSTLFQRRLLRAAQYAERPFELRLSADKARGSAVKAYGFSAPLLSLSSTESYTDFVRDGRLHLTCGESATLDLPAKCVDLVVTDPPFFDYVNYSELADFFFAWQKVMLAGADHFDANTTRSSGEVQHQDAAEFGTRLAAVFSEAVRVLKDDGLFVFTYHHARIAAWGGVLSALLTSGLRVVACHPVKSELSVATPKHKTRQPIQFDMVLVCRKAGQQQRSNGRAHMVPMADALRRAEAQVRRLHARDWELSRGDVRVIVLGQLVREFSHAGLSGSGDSHFAGLTQVVEETVGRLWSKEGATEEGGADTT